MICSDTILMLARRGRNLACLGAFCALFATGAGWAAEPAGGKAPDVKSATEKPADAKPAPASADKKTSATYPLDTCIVSGDKLGGAMGPPVKYDYKGREVRFCCKACVKDFQKAPAKYLAKLDAAVIKQQKPAYPLTTCVVSGAKLDAMGPAIDYVAKDNRLVRFCCPACPKKFEADPAKYEAMIDAAAKAKPAPAPGKPAV